MKDLVAGLFGWFRGKKTIIGGVLVMVGAVAGVWYGKLDPVTGVTVLGFGLSIAGWGSKANRHQAELLAALQGIGQAGADARGGKPIIADLEAAAGQLTPAAVGEAVQIGGASLHLSAPTTEELLSAVSKLTAAPPAIHFTPTFIPPPGFNVASSPEFGKLTQVADQAGVQIK